MSSSTEIPFWFHDRPKWVSGISRHTTCQDVLNSLVKAHLAKAGNSKDYLLNAHQLVLVEQWRGVERPLSNSSRILKLWSAWGEERSQVRFVVKKISSSEVLKSSSNTNSLSRTRVKTRRRNSRLASSSRSSVTDTVHPSALISRQPSSSSTSTGDIERLMRIILSQGETIHSQLKRLQEREGQIETIEEEVHASRTKTAGKDYLLNAYLEHLSDGETKGKNKIKPSSKEEDVPECLHEMLEALTRVCQLNEEISAAEEKLGDLHSKVNSRRSQSADSSCRTKDDSSLESLESTRVEISRLKMSNDRVGKEVDHNRRLISSMRSAFDQRRAIVSQLEQDVDHVESEGHRLEGELRRVTQVLFDGSDLFVANDDLDDEEEDLLNDIIDERHFRLSSSQLYEDAPMQQSGKMMYKTGLELLGVVHPPGLELLGVGVVPPGCSDAARISATGSPGSSTSGNSSSGCGTGSEKSVRFSERELILATPDLPPLPPGDFPGLKSSSSSSSQFTKSILKAVDPSGDLDSNSDTGLSSLHSSSDEGTYVLDTLV